jgi:hypothetical protein
MIFFFILAQQATVGQGLLFHVISRSHSDTYHSVGLLWTSNQPVAETSDWQHTTLTTDIHALGRIRTHSLSRWAVADLRLRPRDQWDRLSTNLPALNTLLLPCSEKRHEPSHCYVMLHRRFDQLVPCPPVCVSAYWVPKPKITFKTRGVLTWFPPLIFLLFSYLIFS